MPLEFKISERESLSSLLSIEDAKTRRHFTSGFVITNKGKLNFPEQYGSLNLKAYFTASSRQAGDIVMNLSVTSLFNKIFFTFTYAEPLIRTAWAEKFADKYLSILAHQTA